MITTTSDIRDDLEFFGTELDKWRWEYFHAKPQDEPALTYFNRTFNEFLGRMTTLANEISDKHSFSRSRESLSELNELMQARIEGTFDWYHYNLTHPPKKSKEE